MSNMLTSRLAPEKGEGISWIAIRCPIKLFLSAHINPKGVTPIVRIHSQRERVRRVGTSATFRRASACSSTVLSRGVLYDTLAEL